MAPDTLRSCAKKLLRFAEQSCRGQSPLYEHLCSRTADDDGLLRIVKDTPDGQPVPNLFLAAVHFLLLSGAEHELRSFYRSCVLDPNPHEDAFPAFSDFCLTNESPIRGLMAHRRVQTNEVRRCAYLLPAFSYIARLAGSRPLALIEVGTSAGLNLIWDRYAYDYGTDKLVGRPDARVRIAVEPKGDRMVPLPDQFSAVAHRVGVDLHVPNLADQQAIAERIAAGEPARFVVNKHLAVAAPPDDEADGEDEDVDTDDDSAESWYAFFVEQLEERLSEFETDPQALVGMAADHLQTAETLARAAEFFTRMARLEVQAAEAADPLAVA